MNKKDDYNEVDELLADLPPTTRTRVAARAFPTHRLNNGIPDFLPIMLAVFVGSVLGAIIGNSL